MRRKNGIIVWPQYFDKNRSRKLGRRIPKSKASSGYNLEDVSEAAKRAGFINIIDATPKYPATWWDAPGRLIVETKDMKKYDILKKIAAKIPEAYTARITQKAKGKKINKNAVVIKSGKAGKYAKYESLKEKKQNN